MWHWMIISYWADPVDSASDISHYGVKGMKWGVRKNSKRVGKAVKKRLREELTGHKVRDPKPNASRDYARTVKLSRKKMYQLSNKEITELNTRYNLEKQYKENRKYDSVARRIINGVKNQSTTIITSTIVGVGTAVATGLIAQRNPELAQYIPKPGGKKKKK
mgnify:CR=1 FL=1